MNHKKKRGLELVLLFSVLMISFVACGSTDSASTNSAGSNSASIHSGNTDSGSVEGVPANTDTTLSPNDVPPTDDTPSLPFGNTITTSDCISAAITADGKMLYTGEFTSAPGSDIISIDAYSDHFAVLYADHTVRLMTKQGFRTEFYDVPSLSKWTDIVAVSAGDTFTVGLKADGTVVGAGYSADNFETISSWTDIVAIDCSYYVIGLKSDGTVVSTKITDKKFDLGQTNVSEFTDIIAISANYTHTIGLKSDGTIVVAGEREEEPEKIESWTNIAFPTN